MLPPTRPSLQSPCLRCRSADGDLYGHLMSYKARKRRSQTCQHTVHSNPLLLSINALFGIHDGAGNPISYYIIYK